MRQLLACSRTSTRRSPYPQQTAFYGKLVLPLLHDIVRRLQILPSEGSNTFSKNKDFYARYYTTLTQAHRPCIMIPLLTYITSKRVSPHCYTFRMGPKPPTDDKIANLFSDPLPRILHFPPSRVFQTFCQESSVLSEDRSTVCRLE